MSEFLTEKDIQPNTVEEVFCKPLSNYEPMRMDEDQTRFMVILFSIKEESMLLEFEAEFKKICWFYPAIQKRLDHVFTYKMDKKSQLLLASWCESIGQVVMYMTLLQYKCKQRNLKEVDLDKFVLMFADGKIPPEYMSAIWRKQKAYINDREVNLVDYAKACESLKF